MGLNSTTSFGYSRVGLLGDFVELQVICGAIFSKEKVFSLPDGTRLKTKIFKNSLLAVEHKGLRYVEQNPNTQSAYAARARGGSQIVWIIRVVRKVDGHWIECNEWLGRVEDGSVWMKKS